MANVERMSVSVPKSTVESVRQLAEKNQRTLSSMVSVILADAVKQEAQKSR